MGRGNESYDRKKAWSSLNHSKGTGTLWATLSRKAVPSSIAGSENPFEALFWEDRDKANPVLT